MLAHRVGLCDEYPSIRYPEDVEHHGYSVKIAVGMSLCVEAYIGAEGGHEGVKSDEQIIVTDTGCKRLSTYPHEADLLS